MSSSYDKNTDKFISTLTSVLIDFFSLPSDESLLSHHHERVETKTVKS